VKVGNIPAKQLTSASLTKSGHALHACNRGSNPGVDEVERQSSKMCNGAAPPWQTWLLHCRKNAFMFSNNLGLSNLLV
jgi:hypothetical protein